MRRTTISILFAAASIAAFSACQKAMEETMPEVSPEVEEITTMKVIATPEDLSAAEEDSKSYIGTFEGTPNTIIWGKGEYLKLIITGASGNPVILNSSETSADANNGNATGSFEFDVNGGFQELTGPFTYCGIYPASGANSIPDNVNPERFKFDLPKVQNATATSYDPKAYIMVAKPTSFDEIQGEWNAAFRRATALNCITLKNLNDDIVRVAISAPDKDLTYRRYFNLKTGESGDVVSGADSTITVNYASPLAAGSDKDVWFTSWGVSINEGERLTITAYSKKFSYTRTITARTEGISFKEGWLNTLGVNMSSAIKEEVFEYPGDYLIANAKNGAYYLMATENASAYFDKINIPSIELADLYDIDNIDSYVWTVNEVEGGYTLSNTEGKYLNHVDGKNQAKTSEAPEIFSLSIDKDSHAATITPTEASIYSLQYNSSSPRFAFYTSAQTPVMMLKWTPDTRTPFNAPTGLTWDSESKTISWDAADGASNGYEYTLDNGVTTVSSETNSIDCSAWPNGDYGIKVRVMGTTDHKISDWTEELAFNISGGAESLVFVKYSGAITEGDYLLVYEGSAMKAEISSNRLQYSEVTPVDDEIMDPAENLIWHIAPSDSYWTIFNEDADKYAAGTGTSNKADLTTTLTDFALWSVSGTDTYDFTNKGNADKGVNKTLRRNSTYGFACYGAGTGGALSLYKLQGSITPQCQTPVITISDTGLATITCDTEGAVIRYTFGTSPDDPTEESDLFPAEGKQLEVGQTIKAAAFKDGHTPSETASKKYSGSHQVYYESFVNYQPANATTSYKKNGSFTGATDDELTWTYSNAGNTNQSKDDRTALSTAGISVSDETYITLGANGSLTVTISGGITALSFNTLTSKGANGEVTVSANGAVVASYTIAGSAKQNVSVSSIGCGGYDAVITISETKGSNRLTIGDFTYTR